MLTAEQQASYPVPQVLLPQDVEDRLRRSPRRQCSRKCKKLESTFFHPLAACFDLRKSGALRMVGFQCTSTATLGAWNWGESTHRPLLIFYLGKVPSMETFLPLLRPQSPPPGISTNTLTMHATCPSFGTNQPKEASTPLHPNLASQTVGQVHSQPKGQPMTP